MILRPSSISTDRFTWDPKDRQFVAEMSDLGREFRFGRVFDDADDEGFTLVSARTGQERPVAVNHIEYRDGDLLWWDLVPAEKISLGAWTVRIFND